MDGMAKRLAVVEGDIGRMSEVLQRVDRRQEMMLDSQLRQERKDRS